ncbi:protein ALTERED PHOSPHATE STARVATION RESPONSE 1 [Sesamum angolense]|uniref:Protein ALTERED PHOSPHATE STARVATION RESPONSE 1 n=1 Tax=Sesamum angolense TaxID=2727404 RepID=A0AAE1X4Z4_9LAMI|nr:protein ALTERED PHOSPHATE STARVATION RESPONSE 1 [Sesamum angolense]
MGCVASRLLEEEEEVVPLCRERKNQLKLAVERRIALADAHYRYCQSLFGVSAAINLFVARHSSPPSPFYITFPPPSPPPSPPKENVVSNPLFLQQTRSEPTKEAIVCESCSSSTSSEYSKEECQENNQRVEEQVCGYFYMDMPEAVASPSPQRDFGWDFFNPFVSATSSEVSSVYNRISEVDLRVVREQEGIPELEDEEGERVEEEKTATQEKETPSVEQEEHGTEAVKAVESANGSHGEQQEKVLKFIDTPVRGRELLEALKDIEDHFIRAYESGKEVSRMLECNRVQLHSNLEEIKGLTFSVSENSTKLIQAITWRSASSHSSSCKSLVASGPKSSSTWIEFSNQLFDDYGGMASGSHSLTLGRLYAWEKKLYEEVKEGDSIRRAYGRKWNQLINQDARGDEGFALEKTRAAVKDLYSRIIVSIRSAETISRRIEKLRDEELEPQIKELHQGMMRTWKIMSESHEIQNKIISEVKTFTCPSYGKFCNESHRLATLQLETELVNWRGCFAEYIAAQKVYIEALLGWLSKFVAPEVEFYSRDRASARPNRSNGPPLLIVCLDWLDSMNVLPEKAVSSAMKSCVKDVRALWLQQGEEQLQKRRVDSLSKELDKKILAFQKAENRISEFRVTDKNADGQIEGRLDSLTERKNILENFRRRVDLEKEKHRKCMEETERIILNGFRTGFGGLFESITEFSSAAFKLYTGLATTENLEKVGKPPCMVDGEAQEICSK